jgi:chromosome segregation ATPase
MINNTHGRGAHMNEKPNEVCEKVIRLETKVEGLESKLVQFDGLPTMLAEINTTLKYQIENSERRDDFIEKQTAALQDISNKHNNALNEIAANMSKQTETMERLNDKIDNTDRTLNDKIDKTDKRLYELDRKINDDLQKDEKRWSIHFADIWQKLFWLGVGAAGLKLVTWFFDLMNK